MKQLLVAGIVASVLCAACGGPLYKPGTVRETAVNVTGTAADQEGYITVNESIRLYYFSKGTGEPVLMIHGGPGYPFSSSWKGLEPLADRFRFIYYHQRGAGKSTRPIDTFESGNYYRNMMTLEEALGLATQLRDIEAWRTAAGAETITLIGHSYGGFLAALYAAEYPDRVKKLVLSAPAEVVRMPMKYSGGLYESVEASLSESEKKEFRAFMKRFFDYGNIFKKSERELQDLNYEFVQFYAAAYTPEAGVPQESMYTADEMAGWGQHALFFSTGQKYDLTKFICTITAPTLILTGGNDLASEREILDTYGKIPGAVHRKLDAGHFAFEEDADSFGKAVEEFLGSGQ